MMPKVIISKQWCLVTPDGDTHLLRTGRQITDALQKYVDPETGDCRDGYLIEQRDHVELKP